MSSYHKKAMKAQRKNVARNMSHHHSRRQKLVFFTLRYPLRFVDVLHSFLSWVLYKFRGVQCECCNDCGFTFMWPPEMLDGTSDVEVDTLSSDFDWDHPNQFCNCLAGQAVKHVIEHQRDEKKREEEYAVSDEAWFSAGKKPVATGEVDLWDQVAGGD